MSYSPTVFWTVLIGLLFSGVLHAQDRALMHEISRLSSPTSFERVEAIEEIAAWPGDIGSNLRVAYRFASRVERMGLLEAAALREDSALVVQAAEGLTEAGLEGAANDYLLRIPADMLTLDAGDLSNEQRQAWIEFRAFRLRRDISLALLDAHQKPGKYFGQFDDLRTRDGEGLDRELLKLLRADSSFGMPLSLAARTRLEQGVEAHRAFSPAWRLLGEGMHALPQALEVYAATETRADVDNPRLPPALILANELRAAAARALALSDNGSALIRSLHPIYQSLVHFEPDESLRQAANPERVLKELEITLARFGDGVLLDARIDRMRSGIRNFQASAATNIHLRHVARPDLIAQHEIAHLMLRAGDTESAEREWRAALDDATQQLKEADPRSRQSLVSFRAATFYNLACAQALQLKLSRSLESLQSAVENGYRDFTWMLEDGDLVHLRRSPAFSMWFIDVAPPAVADRFQSSRP